MNVVSVTRFLDQSTCMNCRSYQGRSASFSAMTFCSSPVVGLYSRRMSKCLSIAYMASTAPVSAAGPVMASVSAPAMN